MCVRKRRDEVGLTKRESVERGEYTNEYFLFSSKPVLHIYLQPCLFVFYPHRPSHFYFLLLKSLSLSNLSVFAFSLFFLFSSYTSSSYEATTTRKPKTKKVSATQKVGLYHDIVMAFVIFHCSCVHSYLFHWNTHSLEALNCSGTL